MTKKTSETEVKKVSTVIYAIILISLAIYSGNDAYSAFAKSSWGKSLLYAVKGSIKTHEAVGIFKKVKSKIK